MPLNMTIKQARDALPADLHETLDNLIQDYEGACKENVKGGKVFRNYGIHCALVQAGWRKSTPHSPN